MRAGADCLGVCTGEPAPLVTSQLLPFTPTCTSKLSVNFIPGSSKLSVNYQLVILHTLSKLPSQ